MKRPWLLFDGFAIALIPKAASTAIINAVGSFGAMGWSADALRTARRYAFMREWRDRLEDLWSFTLHLQSGSKGKTLVGMGNCKSWEAFIDGVLISKDPHVVPQTRWLSTQDGVFAPTDIYSLSELDRRWHSIFPKSMPLVRMNATKRVAVKWGYRMKELQTKYALDAIVYEKAERCAR